MSLAEVGGQLETVPPRQSLFGPDYLRIAVLVGVSALVHLWLVAHTAVPARDSLGYARIALNLVDPRAGAEPGQDRQRIDVIRTAEQPPGYPLAVLVCERLLARVVELPLSDRALLATQVANAVSGVLLVVPLYLIGRILFNRNAGFSSALLFSVLPVPARVTSDGLSEGLYLLVAAAAVLLAVRTARRPGVGGYLLCGLATGGCYLVRPEGLMVAGAAGGVILAFGLIRRWPRDLALGRLTALAVGVALVAVPYMVLIGKITNKPSGRYLTDPMNNIRPRIYPEQSMSVPARVSGPLFAAWWDPQLDQGKNRLVWAARAVGAETVKALHFGVAVLAVIGLVAHRRQLFAPDGGLWVLLALVGLNVLLLLYLAMSLGYVSERHTVLVVLLSCVFAAAALEPLARAVTVLPGLGRLVIWPGATPWVCLVLLVASALPYTLKPLHPQREGHKHAGQWLAGNLGEGDHLVDPLTWGEWYAGRTLYRTVEYKGQPEATWVIVETGKTSPHSRLPQWERARELAAQGERVYRWPADAAPGAFAVEVYRIVHRSSRKPEGRPEVAVTPGPGVAGSP